MFFVLSKLLTVLTVPSHLLLAVALAGVVLLATRFRKLGLRLLIASMAVTAVIWLLPVDAALTLPLEMRFPPWTPAQGAPTGMIVLGGVINPQVSRAHGQIALDGSAERLTAALALARQYPKARIVFSGGNANLIGGFDEGQFALKFFEELGVPRDRLTIEAQSRNTAENAAFCKRLIAPKPGERWLLITTAMHMPRAVGAFREVGFPVVPYPVDYQLDGWRALWRLGSGGMGRTDAAVHEWLGLFAYWITGRIPVLFPGEAAARK
jgi:uncharacterized SAM-binding protein YcdF (DUF218 family)